MKKKVLFVTRKYPPQTGGMENLCYNVANHLSNDGYEVKLVALGKRQYHLIWFFPYVLFYIAFNAHKYDYLLLGDGVMCMCGAVCKLFAKKTKRVIILHGLDMTFKNPIYQLYIKMFLRKCSDLYICNSSYTQSIAKECDLIGKIIVITPGIEGQGFTGDSIASRQDFCTKYNVPENNLIIITVGRLVKRKGVEWFVRNVMVNLDNVTYLVIGDGEERENIENAIKECGQENAVKMLGRVSDEDWLACYQNADVFAMPNFHVEHDVEGFGIVAAEASLAGLIVVASEVDGIPDAIIDGKNGILLESLNKDAYISKIEDIQENLDSYKEKTVEFSEYTRTHYSWDEICNQYRENMDQI